MRSTTGVYVYILGYFFIFFFCLGKLTDDDEEKKEVISTKKYYYFSVQIRETTLLSFPFLCHFLPLVCSLLIYLTAISTYPVLPLANISAVCSLFTLLLAVTTSQAFSYPTWLPCQVPPSPPIQIRFFFFVFTEYRGSLFTVRWLSRVLPNRPTGQDLPPIERLCYTTPTSPLAATMTTPSHQTAPLLPPPPPPPPPHRIPNRGFPSPLRQTQTHNVFQS